MHTAGALEARGLVREYPGGVRALDGVDLKVSAGETVVLVGESGSGKTTLLRMFNRLDEPGSGSVMAGGEPIESINPTELRRRTGYVQQEGGLLPHWPVARNVELVPALLGWEKDRRARRADELLDLVGLPPAEFRTRYPRQLSGGQRQRVAFARALAADPDVILLDEPFGALDALTRLEMQREFLRLKQVLGKTMLMVTHDLLEACKLADRIAVMRSGCVLQVAAPDDLRRNPANQHVRDLLSMIEGESA